MKPGEIISYQEMCGAEGARLQRGMNYRLRGGMSVLLMNLGHNAPYEDRIEEGGRVLVYEGHDVPRRKGGSDPKTVNQPEFTPGGNLTQNGLFHRAAKSFRAGKRLAELVKVYEKKAEGSGPTGACFIWLTPGANSAKIERFSNSGLRRSVNFRFSDGILSALPLDDRKFCPSSCAFE